MTKRADAKGPIRKERATRFNDVEFVQYELSKEEKLDLKNRWKGEVNPLDLLAVLVEEGYKVTFKWDEYGSCHSVFINATPDTPNNVGKVLTGRGRLPETALLEALYKHGVIFDGIWPTKAVPKGYEAWDD